VIEIRGLADRDSTESDRGRAPEKVANEKIRKTQ